MEQTSQWLPSGGSASNKNKLPFVTPIKVTATMDDTQKKFFTEYNNMQKELIKHGLMESK